MICLDSSVLFEIAQQNPRFQKYCEGEFVIPDTTLAEFSNIMLKSHNEKTGDYWFRTLQGMSQETGAELLYAALKFKWRLKHHKLSFFDAVAYVFSQQHGHTLITTDNDFRNLPGVKVIAR